MVERRLFNYWAFIRHSPLVSWESSIVSWCPSFTARRLGIVNRRSLNKVHEQLDTRRLSTFFHELSLDLCRSSVNRSSWIVNRLQLHGVRHSSLANHCSSLIGRRQASWSWHILSLTFFLRFLAIHHPSLVLCRLSLVAQLYLVSFVVCRSWLVTKTCKQVYTIYSMCIECHERTDGNACAPSCFNNVKVGLAFFLTVRF